MCPPRRVLLIARQLDQGGSERQLAETARALDAARFEPHVGVFRSGGLRWDELRKAGVPLTELSIRSLASPRGAFNLASYVHRHEISLVHTFDTPSSVYCVPAARMAGVSRVLSSQRAHRNLMPQFRRLMRITDLLADGVVVNCEFLRRHLVEEEGVSPRRVHLCRNGIDLDGFADGPRQRPEALRESSVVIGVVCGLRPEKSLDTLVAAFARLAPAYPGLKLAIVGSGACEPGLRAQAEALGATPSLVFEPATAEVAKWLRGIDIFVLPSLTEALSNSLMEAMACGCCAVASRVGGNPELVKGGETGLVFEPRDSAGLAAALKRLIDNPGLRAALARNGTRLIREQFSVQVCARRMGEIYASALESAN